MKDLFVNILHKSKEYKTLVSGLKEGLSPICLTGVSDTAVSHLLHGFYHDHDKPILVVTHSDSEARKLADDLQAYGNEVWSFPTKEMVFFKSYAHSNQVIQERLRVIYNIVSSSKGIIVTTLEAMQAPLVEPELWKSYVQSFKVGDVVDLDRLSEQLYDMGFERTDMVEAEGQYAIRGGILDVFSARFDYPIRIELFDDEVDSIRFFSVTSQKSIEKLENVEIIPAKEVFLTDAGRHLLIDHLKSEMNGVSLETDAGQHLYRHYEEVLHGFENNLHFDDLYKYSAYLPYVTANLMDYFEGSVYAFVHEPNRMLEKAQFFMQEHQEKYRIFLEKGEVVKRQYEMLIEPEVLLQQLDRVPNILLSQLRQDIQRYRLEETIPYHSKEVQSYHGKLDDFIIQVGKWKRRGYKVVVAVGHEDRGKQIETEFLEEQVSAAYCSELPAEILTGQCFITKLALTRGYMIDTFKFILVTENELFGISRKKKRSKPDSSRLIKSFNELNPGDYVVHENHGVGKYIGVDQLVIDGLKKDYLKIGYSKDDSLYIPIEQMDLIQKYIGAEGGKLKLNRLGGAEWSKTKAKAKKAIEDMTDELLELYASRTQVKGYAYSPDTTWQYQFEDMFPYEETPDQLKCISEIKADMEKPMVMDRLLCGDVGYGKTEVAIRAIFKAVMESKQVAFLVPTTILAQQHYTNLMERFSKYPIKIEMLSRFRDKKSQERIVEDLRTGVVDVIVGTHRLVSKDVSFKELGLLIIDEEQRFGVKHKEAIKKMKKNVDVLTLTATPIPRTLHMSLIGVRDMSVIEDPPEDRYPIQTYVIEQDEFLMREAILKEVDRGGQVYVVHNRVHDIDLLTSKLQGLLPDIRIAYAHGQMNERKLEKLMVDFYNHEYDVLVCTTIIETGLDISNVNTIIVNEADKLGLSQLYQLRGRVGRSNRLAYAYLMYQKDKMLSEVAEKRLKAIKEFTELGSGFKIAMKDLEIRGAGNLLGASQHGHMSAIGYDLYCKMLEEAVRKVKGQEVEAVVETTIEINANAFIPETYIADPVQKMSIYKKIAAIRNQEDAYGIEEEIEDRYGTIPKSVYNLISIAYIKAMAQANGFREVVNEERSVKLYYDEHYKMNIEAMGKVLDVLGKKLEFNAGSKPHLVLRRSQKDQAPDLILKEVEQALSTIHALNHPA